MKIERIMKMALASTIALALVFGHIGHTTGALFIDSEQSTSNALRCWISTQSFYYVDPVDVTPGTDDSWQDVDVSSYVPAGATGVILHYDMTGSWSDQPIGFRKNGSTDNRRQYNEREIHSWAMIGVDSNRIFEAYIGDTAVDIWLVGYTTDGVVFFDNSVDKTVSSSSTWRDIDISADTGADTAIGVILEVSQGSTSTTWGIRNNGSTDNRRSAYARLHKWAIVGVDSSEIFEGWASSYTNVTFHVLGYVKYGAYFFTNGVDKTPGSCSWTDVDVTGDTVGSDVANGVFIEVYETSSGPDYGLRKNGSGESIIEELKRHAWGFVEVDGSEIYEAYVCSSGPSMHLIGYSLGLPPDSTPPAAPTGLVATPGDSQVSLDWNDNSEPDLDGYNVYRSTTTGGPYSKINGSLVSTSDYTDNTVSNGTTYYYVVTAVDTSTNESGYSNEDSATPSDSNPPAAPTNLVATPGAGEVSLDWDDDTEGDLDGYNVYRSETSGGPYSQINGSLVSVSNYTDNTVSNGTTYYYVVTAVDTSTNESGYSNEDSATPQSDPPPAAPTNLVATPGDGEVSLDWDDNTEGDLDGYNVYRSETSGGPYTKINGSLVSVSNYTDSTVSNGTIYYYVVTAVDTASNESGYSNEDSATPSDSNPPAAPTNLVATPGDGEVSLDWDDNSEGDLDGYNVYRSTTSSGPYSQINGSLVSVSNYTDSTVSNGTTYYYVVTAVDTGSNESGYSNEAGATPIAGEYFLHNNPTPPTGDTNSQAVLPVNTSAPMATTLYNYDEDREDSAGLFIAKGGEGPGDTDPTKHQTWRSGSLPEGLSLVGTVTIDLWAAMKDFGENKAGEVIVYLRDYNGSNHTEIDSGTVYEADWQGGSTTWVQKTITVSGLDYTIPAGNELEVELVVGDNGDDDMCFAYDTVSYSSVVSIP